MFATFQGEALTRPDWRGDECMFAASHKKSKIYVRASGKAFRSLKVGDGVSALGWLSATEPRRVKGSYKSELRISAQSGGAFVLGKTQNPVSSLWIRARGNLSSQPVKLIKARSGVQVALFDIAVSQRRIDRRGKAIDYKNDWVAISVFGKLGVACAHLLVPGEEIEVSGVRAETVVKNDEKGLPRARLRFTATQVEKLKAPRGIIAA